MTNKMNGQTSRLSACPHHRKSIMTRIRRAIATTQGAAVLDQRRGRQLSPPRRSCRKRPAAPSFLLLARPVRQLGLVGALVAAAAAATLLVVLTAVGAQAASFMVTSQIPARTIAGAVRRQPNDNRPGNHPLVLTRTFRAMMMMMTSSRSSNDVGDEAKDDNGDVSSGDSKGLQDDNDNNEDAMLWKQRADELRKQIRQMEQQLDEERRSSSTTRDGGAGDGTTTISNRREDGNTREYEWMGGRQRRSSTNDDVEDVLDNYSLRNKRILVAGANGRLGSMVCRYLLRNYPSTEVVACVHVVSENSSTARGYGRLSYEVGAEDGIGSIGAAWNPDERTATFQYDPATMPTYNLQNLRIVECELLDPVQCQSVVEGCDAVIWCATDFNQNVPRAVSSLNVALLFRAVSRPSKGRVDVEGVENMLGAIKQELQERRQQRRRTNDNGSSTGSSSSSIVNFVLVSTSPDAYEDYETPFGSFRGIKQQGEGLLTQFPSLSTTVLRMARYEDNFVGEDLDIQMEEVTSSTTITDANDDASAKKKSRRKINRRDAAKAAVEALRDESLVGKTVEVWTTT